MFNAEQLLGKIVQETLGNSGGNSGLLDALGSGAGLMTAIGLGVGAYEILTEQKKGEAGAGSKSTPPPVPGATPGNPPPLPTSKVNTPPPVQSIPQQNSDKELSMEKLAVRMIQVMIAAAHADGTLDEDEEQAILKRLRGAELSGEEKMFLLDELHRPKTITELVDGIKDSGSIKTMYLLAAGAVKVDTEAERQWLDTLGNALGLSPAVRNFLEDQVGKS